MITGRTMTTDRNHPALRKPYLARGRSSAMAHRGDRSGHPPGNRVSAFQSAIDLGIDHIESDAHPTADGRVVLFHDDVLDDETTGRGALSDHTWDELAELRYLHDGDELDEGLVLFEDVLSRWPDISWNIDAKESEVVDPLLDIIAEHDAWDRVLVTSFSWSTVRRLRRRIPPRVCTGLPMPEIAMVRLLSWLRLPVPRFGDAVQVPEHHGRVRVVDRRFVEACHRAGMVVHVWTVDDADDMHRLLDLGVDGIITDRPDVLRSVLQARGDWSDGDGSHGDGSDGDGSDGDAPTGSVDEPESRGSDA